ncbi:hypothetical protein BJY04DRAFT_224577 [Aspergillus karnatakaensis]|uniref:uncharacterized protein n=1 Tax=Aspergillus karnatakaensis TaxID=1810916 RepID=UPI003CCD3492
MAETSSDFSPEFMDAYAGNEILAAGIVFILLEILFAIARYTASRIQTTQRGLDDWFIWPALAANIILCVEILILIPLGGVGFHLAAVEAQHPEKIVAWYKGTYASAWLWALAVALPKSAILGFYLRFFSFRVERFIAYIVLIVVLCNFLATGLTTTFECDPVRYQWDKTIENGRCINMVAFYRWSSLPNIVTDAIMLVLPLPMIYQLHLGRIQRTGLAIIFATGGLGIVSSCLRFAVFFDHDAYEDNTWTSVQLLKWTMIEPGVYFLVACMPSFKILFQRAWIRFVSSYLGVTPSGENIAYVDGAMAACTIGGRKRDGDTRQDISDRSTRDSASVSFTVDEELGRVGHCF